MVPKEYYGRLFTKEQLPVDYHSEAFTLESMIKVDKQLRCKRCYSQIEEDWQLPEGQYYCRACIVFGRNQEGKELYYFPSKTSEIEFPVLKWLGELTPYQAEVSEKLLETYQKQKDSLVHAVTGAGKTEMIYKIVAYVLESKGNVAIASPRVDVCRELFLRMQRDFTCSISLLHAESEPYDGSPLVIATTHQLLKFYQSFDLVIVDEVDAYPFVGNVMLNLFLSLALMTLKLWELSGLIGGVLLVVACQVIFMIIIAYFVVFRILGSNYDAAVMCSGLCGHGLGATPSAIVNMTAINEKYGMSRKAMMIVPIVGAFLVDIIYQPATVWFIKTFVQGFVK